MHTNRISSPLSRILCMVLIAAMALTAAGCTPPPDRGETPTYPVSEQPHALGDGGTTFPLTITDLAGSEVRFEISTDQSTIGQALEEVSLISGEEGPYGLMIHVVNGLTLIYEQDKAYWAFYIDGSYATSGVDTTPIVPGESYALKAEKG